MPERYRGFSIVIHNVYLSDREYWTKTINSLKYDETVVSVEEYPESPGQYHCHIFTNHKNPCSKMKLLDFLTNNQTAHIDESVPPEDGKKLGRIHIDPRRGTMAESTAYLTAGLTKKDSKECGVPIAYNKLHLTCTSCPYKNFYKYFRYDYSSTEGLCWKCWKRERLLYLISVNATPNEFNECFDIYSRSPIFQENVK